MFKKWEVAVNNRKEMLHYGAMTTVEHFFLQYTLSIISKYQNIFSDDFVQIFTIRKPTSLKWLGIVCAIFKKVSDVQN